MKSKIKLIIFDWDGTLMDSEQHIVDCMQAAMVDMKVTLRNHKAVTQIIGLALPEAIQTLYPEEDASFVQAFKKRYRHHFFSDVFKPSQLFAGAADVLAYLHRKGYLLAIATGKARHGLNHALESTGLNCLFHETRCADEHPSKPHPEMVQTLLKTFNLLPDQAIMVGDTDYDMLMAKQAGVEAVAVSYGVHDLPRLMKHQPITSLNAIDEIMEWL